jgi:hypothetical protein
MGKAEKRGVDISPIAMFQWPEQNPPKHWHYFTLPQGYVKRYVGRAIMYKLVSEYMWVSVGIRFYRCQKHLVSFLSEQIPPSVDSHGFMDMNASKDGLWFLSTGYVWEIRSFLDRWCLGRYSTNLKSRNGLNQDLGSVSLLMLCIGRILTQW